MDNEEIQTNAQNNNKDSKENPIQSIAFVALLLLCQQSVF